MLIAFSVLQLIFRTSLYELNFGFRDEIDHVLARKEELEKELTDLLAERDTLSESLEMSNTSITTLERKHREQELMIRYILID